MRGGNGTSRQNCVGAVHLCVQHIATEALPCARKMDKVLVLTSQQSGERDGQVNNEQMS